MAKGRKVASTIKLAMVVPGSGLVKQQAEQEGLDVIFKTHDGTEWTTRADGLGVAGPEDVRKWADFFEAGGVAPQLPTMPISVGDSRTFYRGVMATSMADIMETNEDNSPVSVDLPVLFHMD